jgi:hypothetical protein
VTPRSADSVEGFPPANLRCGPWARLTRPHRRCALSVRPSVRSSPQVTSREQCEVLMAVAAAECGRDPVAWLSSHVFMCVCEWRPVAWVGRPRA